MPLTIHQVVTFSAPPRRVYDTLLDAKEFAAFTRSPATIEPSVGGAFQLFDGHIEGRSVELVPSLRIVQAWRNAAWEPGQYSLVRFELRPNGTGTELTFDHTGFPDDAYEGLNSGWPSMYWDPMNAHLGD